MPPRPGPASPGRAAARPLPYLTPPQTECRAAPLNPLIPLAFYLFIFLLPFEAVLLPGGLEPTMLGIGLLFLATLLQPRECFRKPPAAFWFFAAYLYVSLVLGALQPRELRGEIIRLSVVHVQLTLLCWVAFNLMRRERIARTALLLFAAACTLLVVIQGVEIVTGGLTSGSGRLTALGLHPNTMARILALGLLTLTSFGYALRQASSFLRCAALIGFVLMGVSLVNTGSRGGLLALAAGLLVLALSAGDARTRVRMLAVVLVGMSFFVWLASRSEVTRARFEETLASGEMARRELIYPTAWQMVTERPLIGWGPVTCNYELGRRLQHPEEETKNAHNAVLFVLVATGLLGAVPFLLGSGLCLAAAWRSRRGSYGMLPLAMTITVFIANMSGVWIYNKLHWLVMAYAMASGVGPLLESTLTPRIHWLKARAVPPPPDDPGPTAL
ncbi:MAG: O-antigen ligase family protein [Armatimonadota bacterium]